MPDMLGEMLVKVGALTKAQLEQVLNAQAIYGGRLGTNLVEMGFVAEDDLVHVLKEKLGVPCVDAGTVNSIPEDVLAAVPIDLVQRYHVLPVAVSGKKLTLAMADPSDFQAIDEIGFVTGFVVVPRVCTELRLNMALEHYYGIKRAVRYIPVSGGFRSRFSGEGMGGNIERNGDASAEPGATSGTMAVEEPVEIEPLAGETQGRETQAGRRGEPVAVDALADRFAEASSEAEVVSSLLAYLAAQFDRAALLALKSGVVTGVQAVCAGCAVDGFSRFSMPVDEAGLLSQVVCDRRLSIGELGAEGGDGRLLKAMGGEKRSPALVVPLSIEGHLAALICANDLRGRLAGGIFDLQRVAAMAELTFEMICLRRRIKNC